MSPKPKEFISVNEHRLTPENALLRNEWAEINRHSWRLRKVTGGALRLALLMSVPENLREDVEKRVLWLQNKHRKPEVKLG